MFRTIVALALVATTIGSASAHDFTTCKGKSDTLGVSKLTFSPDPPQAGKVVTVHVGGTTPRKLEGGTVIAETRVMGFTVETDTYSLCDTLDHKCPIEAGSSYVGTVSQLIPAATPDKMGATVRVTVKSPTGEVLSCLESYVVVSNHGDPHVETPDGLLGNDATALEGRAVGFVFEAWKAKFPTAFWHRHDAARALSTFAANLKRINEHNANPSATYTMALNEFAGMTADEFASQRLTGIRHRPQGIFNSLFSSANSLISEVKLRGTSKWVAGASLPDSVDWTEKGAVTQVKNQGSCGSCWAFSAIGAIESAYFLKTGKLVEFSEQELVSCDDSDYGCQGGLMDYAFAWVKKQGGLCEASAYPYTSGTTSARGICASSSCQAVEGSVPTGFVDIPPTEAALQAAVVERPVSVAIEADQAVFQFYHSGVLTGLCGTHLDHGVLLVGYGVDAKSGTPYWKVKNSWGAAWGEQGYVRIQKGKRWPKGGECGINSAASYPVL